MSLLSTSSAIWPLPRGNTHRTGRRSGRWPLDTSGVYLTGALFKSSRTAVLTSQRKSISAKNVRGNLVTTGHEIQYLKLSYFLAVRSIKSLRMAWWLQTTEYQVITRDAPLKMRQSFLRFSNWHFFSIFYDIVMIAKMHIKKYN